MVGLISCRVYNRPGVLAVVSAFLARKQINIQSVTLTETKGQDTALMIIAAEGEGGALDGAVEGLRSFDDIFAAEQLDRNHYLDRELLLVKVAAKPADIPLVMQILETMRATVLAMGQDAITIEMSGSQERISALRKLLGQFHICEYARSGTAVVGKEG